MKRCSFNVYAINSLQVLQSLSRIKPFIAADNSWLQFLPAAKDSIKSFIMFYLNNDTNLKDADFSAIQDN